MNVLKITNDGYFVNCYPNKHIQRFEIVSILTQASMKT
jgi:hypothetical protein